MSKEEAPRSSESKLSINLADVNPLEVKRLFSKVRGRLMPLLFFSFALCFLDRMNVGFAQLQMRHELGIGDAAFGFGAGLFFVTYAIFEIPSNLWMERIGARRLIVRVMVGWGLVSALTMLVRGPNHFYIARLALGAAEAGFFPGMILYMSYWFPSSERGRATAYMMAGPTIAGVFGSPLSAQIMTRMHNLGGMSGWQWVLLIEGIPCAILGIINFYYYCDGPKEAKWLNEREKAILQACLDNESSQMPHSRHGRWRQAFADPYVYLMMFLWFDHPRPGSEEHRRYRLSGRHSICRQCAGHDHDLAPVGCQQVAALVLGRFDDGGCHFADHCHLLR